jgi:oligogalacturonide lyase
MSSPEALSTSLPEQETLVDRRTGVSVRRLTNHFAHSCHLYFTNDGWWDDGRRLVFLSERHNGRDLYSVELATGEITQITRLGRGDFQAAFVNPRRPELCFWRRGEEDATEGRDTSLAAVNLETGFVRTVYEPPAGFVPSNVSIAADGRHVFTGLREDVDLGFRTNLRAGYVGFKELFEAHPLARIVRVDLDTLSAEVIHEEPNWITHVNASPTRPGHLSFCHEGPWDRVRQRMWGLDADGGKVWPIRPQAEDEAIGHEYWLAEGETLGYHGRTPAGPVFGFVDFAPGSTPVETPFPHDSQHFFSLTRDLIVGDGVGGRSPYVLLWPREGDAFGPPRVLCEHRSSRHLQITHVHPRLSRDGKQVLFTSDATGYGQLHLVEIPPLDTLPTLASLSSSA